MRPIRVLICTAVAAMLTMGWSSPAQAADDDEQLYLVTLRGPGTAATSPDSVDRSLRAAMRETQRSVLEEVGADAVLYQWTFTLNGFAAPLSRSQARSLATDERVETVQLDQTHPLASNAAQRGASSSKPPAAPEAGEGTVIGFIDSGIVAAGPSFADVPALGQPPRSFAGRCPDDDSVRGCGGKILAADFFVDGFGTDELSSNATLSAIDTDGHGTRMASLAAGNSEVEVKVGGERRGTTGGVAPAARVASYKACWSAPDPQGDGCSTADVVAAVETAAVDGVDVLNLGMSGAASVDTVARALLGAVESGVVVVGPAGNHGERDLAAYPSPWVISVGATIGQQPRGRLLLGDGSALQGAMSARQTVGPTDLVRAEDVATDSATTKDARRCVPGSLDAAATEGTVVICERGGVARTDKSHTVGLADGVGMVLVNASPASLTSDLHTIPTIHLTDGDARRLNTYLNRSPDASATLEPDGVRPRLGVVAPWSAKGDPQGKTIKPDLVAPGTGAIAVGPDQGDDLSWSIVSGTSVAAARTSGVAASLLADGRNASDVHSMLLAQAKPLPGSEVLSVGNGLLNPTSDTSSALVLRTPPSTYRPWLEGRRRELNTVGVVMDTQRVAIRRVTNTSDRSVEVAAAPRDFAGEVRVRPTAFSIAPGETTALRISARQSAEADDQGVIELSSVDGGSVRLPVRVTD